jgi:hypothetical protein
MESKEIKTLSCFVLMFEFFVFKSVLEQFLYSLHAWTGFGHGLLKIKEFISDIKLTRKSFSMSIV